MPTKKSPAADSSLETHPAPKTKPRATKLKTTKKKSSVKPAASDNLMTLDPIELAVMTKVVTEDIYLPHRVRGSVVTMDEVTSILNEVPLTNSIEDAFSAKGKKSVTKVSVTDDVLKSGILSQSLSEVHRAVIDAALSLLAAGNQAFTAAMLYRTMIGDETGKYIHKAQQQMVDDIMRQLMYTPLHIDMNVYNKKSGAIEGNSQLEGPILPAERIKMNIAGTTCTAYQITTIPILYRLCKAIHGITVTPISILSVDMNYTHRNLVVLNFLQRRIAPILYPVNGPYEKTGPIFIPYVDIYESAARISGDQYHSNPGIFRKRIRETVKIILNTWVMGGFLRKWSEARERNIYTGCRLFFPGRPPSLPPLSVQPE